MLPPLLPPCRPQCPTPATRCPQPAPCLPLPQLLLPPKHLPQHVPCPSVRHASSLESSVARPALSMRQLMSQTRRVCLAICVCTLWLDQLSRLPSSRYQTSPTPRPHRVIPRAPPNASSPTLPHHSHPVLRPPHPSDGKVRFGSGSGSFSSKPNLNSGSGSGFC
ncbi:hypothetical protein B0H10DRAFT_753 [Mycena sp. CBHHK59/15]|nr:hypothetical protein B0H10DRAFT_753 [Mycena sp. CBHHK59/15]